MEDVHALAGRLFSSFLRRTHLCAPSEIPQLVSEEAAMFGATDVVIYLVDEDQRLLVPLTTPETGPLETVSIEGTLHGRAFATTTIVEARTGRETRRRVLAPLLDGTERLGTLQLVVDAVDGSVPEHTMVLIERYSHLVAQTVVTKNLYGDIFEVARRRRSMAVSAELTRGLLPPFLFATRDLVIAGMLEPAYDAGGDTFDYAVNDRTAHLSIFDAMGHGLIAAGYANYAVAAYRVARRRRASLAETYLEIDDTIKRQPEQRFVTGILAELDLDTGRLHWLSAGHPPPLLLRDGKLVKLLESPPETPFGIDFGTDSPVVSSEHLEPGDQVVLYTDGVPEARLQDGSFFTEERMADFVEREAGAGHTTPETLRRLRRAILEHQQGELQDDATILLVEWAGGGERRLVPQTVL